MSHFAVLVLVPENEGHDVQAHIDRVLAPYNEGLAVPEYDKRCHCVGDMARKRANVAADEKFGTINAMRERFRSAADSANETEEQSDERWRKLIDPRIAFETEFVAADPDRDSPDPTCGFYTERFCPEGGTIGERFEDDSGCGGTGTYRSTYNPRSKWDWFQIGGRWTGALTPGYEPDKDPRNFETCWLCDGTGTRKDGMVVAHGCNGCEGVGRMLKNPSKWVGHDRNIMPVAALPVEFVPFAVVTPDGQWHERGRMGWFACVADEKSKDLWSTEYRALLDANPEATAVLVDCHI